MVDWEVDVVGGACKPVAPVGNANSLDDEDDHLAEEDEEEKEEANGAIGPERADEEIQSKSCSLMPWTVLVLCSHLNAL